MLKEKLFFIVKSLFVDICKAFFYVERLFFNIFKILFFGKFSRIVLKVLIVFLTAVFIVLLFFIFIVKMAHNASNKTAVPVEKIKTVEPQKQVKGIKVYRTIDFQDESESVANDVLYAYISAAMARKYVMDNYDISLIHSFAVDLNNDGINEVAAYINSNSFCSSETKCRLFILNKTKTGYKNISKIDNFNPRSLLYISKNKGYKNLYYNDGENNYVARYKNGAYKAILK